MLDTTQELPKPVHAAPGNREKAGRTDIKTRPAETDDDVALHEILTSKHVVDGTMRLPHARLALTRQRLEPKADRVQLVAVLDSEIVGFAEVLTQFDNPRARHAAVLNLIATRADMQSRGVATGLLEAVIDLADSHWGLRRLSLLAWADNGAAIRLYERFGFVQEGCLRDFVRSGARFQDAVAMARIRG